MKSKNELNRMQRIHIFSVRYDVLVVVENRTLVYDMALSGREVPMFGTQKTIISCHLLHTYYSCID